MKKKICKCQCHTTYSSHGMCKDCILRGEGGKVVKQKMLSLAQEIVKHKAKAFTQADFLANMAAIYAGNVEISRRKNSDYTDNVDPFQNFRVCEALGIPAEVGLIVRMSDKMSRIANLSKPGRKALVVDESIHDTLADLANYSVILSMYLKYGKR